MKILLVSTAAILTPPEAYGGMERMVNWLSIGLGDLGHDVDVCCKTGSTVANPIFADDESDFVEAVKDNIHDYDVVIDFSHDKRIGREFPEFPQINTYQVMTVGHKINPVFISRGQRKHCGYDLSAPVIYYGLDFNDYPLYEGPREEYLLYIGSLITEKRPHWLAEMAKNLGVKAIVCGPRWQPEYWSYLEMMEGLDYVEVRDEVAGQEKIELIQKAACLVHPVGDRNWVEAGAIIALEALACGTPVLATPNGCLPEYITNYINGYLAHNVEEMVSCYSRIKLVPPSRCRFSVLNRYDYRRMAGDYEKLAEEVIDGRSWG